jgi:hypothetical protein
MDSFQSYDSYSFMKVYSLIHKKLGHRHWQKYRHGDTISLYFLIKQGMYAKDEN